MRLRLFINILLVVTPLLLFSQYFGGFTPDINWFQLESPHVRVIFPAGHSDKANKVASNIEWLIEQDSTRDFKLRKIDLILNNQSVESNAYVGSVPYHSMFFMTPPQNFNYFSNSDWLNQLSIHEYRHVWQYNQMKSGWCKLMYGLMGDKGWGGYIHLIFPRWYFEGDAVYAETKYSNTGRGRLPYFSLTERAMALDSVRYKYIKVRNGSYKDALPNYYQYGYNLVQYGNKKFGEEGWKKIVDNASKLKGVFCPISYAIKKETGMGARIFYDSMQVDFTRHTHEKVENRQITSSQKIVPSSKTVTNYYQSVFETDSTLLVMKNSYKDLLGIYRLNIKTQEERKLIDVGNLDNPSFSYANGTLVWSEFRHDKRFWNKGYSIIKKMNVNYLVERELTVKTNYFSPAISPNGNVVAVVEYRPDQVCSIVIIDALTGERLQEIHPSLFLKSEIFISSPSFSEDGERLYFILKNKDKVALFKYDFQKETLKQLIHSTSYAITSPVSKGSRLYFSASFEGQDDIFYLDEASNQIFRISNSRVGAYYPNINSKGDEVVYSNYTLKGFDLQLVGTDSVQEIDVHKDLSQEEFYVSDFYLKDSVQKITERTNLSHEISKYKKASHAFNIHSWGPIASSLYTTGIELNSDNILNNTSIVAGWYYNYEDANNPFSYVRGSVYYAAHLPIIFGSYIKTIDAPYNLQLLEGGLMLPYDLSTPRNVRSKLFQASYLYQQINDGLTSYDYQGMHLSFKYQNYKTTAKQQVAPREGTSLLIDTRQGILNSEYAVPDFMLQSDLYLPGIMKTHAMKLQADVKLQSLDGYFIDEMDYVRGYIRPYGYVFYGKTGYDYKFPLCYPEIGINGLVYLKRIRMNIFADAGYGLLYYSDLFKSNKYYTSIGAELYFDIKWFNEIDMPFYIRHSHCFKTSETTVPWEIGASLFSFSL